MKRFLVILVVAFSFLAMLNAKENSSLLGEVATNLSYSFIVPPVPGNPDETEVNLIVTSASYFKFTINFNGKKITDTINGYQSKKIALPYKDLVLFDNQEFASQKSGLYLSKAITIYGTYSAFTTSIQLEIKNKEHYGIYDVIEHLFQGKEYVVSSFADKSDNQNKFAPSFTAISGLYDNTRISFELKGNEKTCIEIDGKKYLSGEKMKYTLNEGDVLYLASIGENADLSGSIISASKPIRVVSGNYCAKIDDNDCDFIIENEVPKNLWGDTYLIPTNPKINEPYLLRIFSKQANTNVYLNGEKVGQINGDFLELNMSEDQKKANIISTDSGYRINVIKYGSSHQMQIMPLQNAISRAVFKLPESINSENFEQYVNVIYRQNPNHNADSLEIGEMINGQLLWTNLNDYDVAFPGLPFNKINVSDTNTYYIKTFKLHSDNLTIIRSKRKNELFQVYIGGVINSNSFGYGISYDFYDDAQWLDTLPPVVEFHKHCDGDVANGWVIDEPRKDSQVRSNLGLIIMDIRDSYNYSFDNYPFVIGETMQTDWYLRVIDPKHTAKAHLIFQDRVGNRMDTIVEYYPMLAYVKAADDSTVKDFGKFELKANAEEMTLDFEVYNPSKYILPENHQVYLIQDSKMKDYWKKDDIFKNSHFEILGIKDGNLAPMDSLEKIKFQVKFTANEVGNFEDNLGLVIINENQDTCVYQYFVNVKAKVEYPISVDENISMTEIYPNPASNVLLINKEIPANSFFEIFDLYGKSIQNGIISNNKIDISLLNNGVYFLKINQNFFKFVIFK